jgi:hypothetical protein
MLSGFTAASSLRRLAVYGPGTAPSELADKAGVIQRGPRRVQILSGTSQAGTVDRSFQDAHSGPPFQRRHETMYKIARDGSSG